VGKRARIRFPGNCVYDLESTEREVLLVRGTDVLYEMASVRVWVV
jgi:hypothetical protein